MFIYSLYHAKSKKVYIGKTNDINCRFQKHLSDKIKTKKSSWIKSLKSKGMVPLISIIDIVPDEEWDMWERFWIASYRHVYGVENILNMTDGGDQGPSALGRKDSDETRKKKSLSKFGNKHGLGKFKSKDIRDKMSEAKMKIKKSEFSNVIKMYKDGNTILKISHYYNVSTSVVYNILKNNGFNLMEQRLVVPKCEHDQIINLRKTMTLKEVAEIYNTNRHVISRILKSKNC